MYQRFPKIVVTLAIAAICGLPGGAIAQVGSQLDAELKAQREAIAQLQEATRPQPAEPTLSTGPDAAEANSKLLEKWGSKPVVWPAGDVYLARTVTTPATVACGRWDFTTAGGYSIDPTPQFGKIGTRIICKNGPLLRIRGAGFVLNGPVEVIGDGKSDAIQVEGLPNPSTGRHRIRDTIFRNWGCAVHVLGNEADPNKDAHGDNSRCYDIETANVACVLRLDNQQAVNWRLTNLLANNLNGPAEQIICDINRGGKVTIDGLVCCHPRVTIFRVRDYSPNNCNLECHGLEFDRFDFPCSLTLFKYAGPVWRDADMSWIKWRVRADGFVSPNDKIDLTKWIDAECKGAKRPIDTSDIKWDVRGVEAA